VFCDEQRRCEQEQRRGEDGQTIIIRANPRHNVNLTISIFADVSIFSLPTIKFSAAAGVAFVAGEGEGILAAAVSPAPSRGGPFSFSFRTCSWRMMQKCW